MLKTGRVTTHARSFLVQVAWLTDLEELKGSNSTQVGSTRLTVAKDPLIGYFCMQLGSRVKILFFLILLDRLPTQVDRHIKTTLFICPNSRRFWPFGPSWRSCLHHWQDLSILRGSPLLPGELGASLSKGPHISEELESKATKMAIPPWAHITMLQSLFFF